MALFTAQLFKNATLQENSAAIETFMNRRSLEDNGFKFQTATRTSMPMECF